MASFETYRFDAPRMARDESTLRTDGCLNLDSTTTKKATPLHDNVFSIHISTIHKLVTMFRFPAVCMSWDGQGSGIPYASGLSFHNDAERPIYAPGFGLVIDAQLPRHERFAHGALDWSQPRLTARELEMLQLMNAITDVPGWDDAVFDDAAIAIWRQDASEQWDLISPDAWSWCLSELRDAARAFKDTPLVDVLNAASSVCKADVIIPAVTMTELQTGIDRLARDSDTGPGISHLVDPTLFPLAYESTRVLTKGGHVPLDEIFSTVGKGEPGPHQDPLCPGFHPFMSRPYPWSQDFQMLPCEVRLPGQGDETGRPAITSYVNNLHPQQYSSLYPALESVLEAAIPMWNRVVLKPDEPRLPRRIRTYGGIVEPRYPPSWLHELPFWPEDTDPQSEAYQRKRAQVEEYLAQPDAPPALLLPDRWGNYPYRWYDFSDWEEQLGLWEATKTKFERLRRAVHPEPGVSFSYDEWRRGEAGRPVVPGHVAFCKRYHPGDNGGITYTHQQGTKFAADDPTTVLKYPHHIPYDVDFDLRESWREQGLQVVVQVTRTTLSPLQPYAKEQDWHIHGTITDRIVAAAVVVVDSHNVATQSIDFRVQAELCAAECGLLRPTELRALEITFGLPEEPWTAKDRAPAFQELGSVKLPVGRLVAYPNALQHRMQSRHLIDPTSPGHQDCLTLLLVDPHYRLCSTANVPPQRHDWWFDASLEGLDWPKKLPFEMIYEIESYVDDFPVSMDRARAWQAKMHHDAQVCQESINHSVDKYHFMRGDGYPSP
ncbi:hypothetical protein B0T18DRAFT_231489 [Schizothecium vesticola]|uniref:Uncharacterized protein n=1 Tax=Schizothecium vesticola TaxID=314040 RepID=A0AA40K0U5_9PEZI|nr:hypothetical protein B0T18DRAFT_231489 [Schizothecium vesticola]